MGFCQLCSTSLGMGSINRSTVQDLCDANTAVEKLKAEPYLGCKLPHIPFHKIRWATWANAAEDHSQEASLVGATSVELWDNAPFPFALLSHKSHCLKHWLMSIGFVDFLKSLPIPVSTLSNGQQNFEIVVSWWQHVRQMLS